MNNTTKCAKCSATTVQHCDENNCGYLGAGNGAPLDRSDPELAVWYGKMPESNGKSNWTAILYRKGEGGFMGRLSEGITIARSEYEDRVRYEADRMRYLIGDLAVEPDILAYDANLRSDYVYPPNALEARIAKLEEALAFYAEGDHFMVTDEGAWEECGEALPNFSRDDEGTAYVEDGSTAKTALEDKV